MKGILGVWGDILIECSYNLQNNQVEVYKEDFRMERQDREEAHSKLAELEMKEKELMERIALHQQEV